MDVDTISSIRGRIDRTLMLRVEFAASGVTFVDDDLWNKAFRLKRLGRCPRCDDHLKVWRDYREMGAWLECLCGFTALLHDTDFIHAEDTDDPILDLIREELGYGIEVEQLKLRRWRKMLLGIVIGAVGVVLVVGVIVVGMIVLGLYSAGS